MPSPILLSAGMVALSAMIAAIPARRPQMSAASTLASVHEARLRRFATNVVRPKCPATVPAEPSTVVAIVQPYIDRDGRVLGVEPVDVPDAAVGQAVADAVMRWTFQIPPEDLPPRFVMTGKLTFYFSTRATACTALSPSEAPSYRDWPDGRVPIARGAAP